MKNIPEKYIEVEKWIRIYLSRYAKFKNRFDSDEEFRKYLGITGSAETASLKRVSMELTRALSNMRKASK